MGAFRGYPEAVPEETRDPDDANEGTAPPLPIVAPSPAEAVADLTEPSIPTSSAPLSSPRAPTATPRLFRKTPDTGPFGIFRRNRGERVALSVMGALVACGAVMLVFAPRKPDADVATKLTGVTGAPLMAASSAAPEAAIALVEIDAGVAAEVDAGPRAPAFRVASLKSDAVDVTELPLGSRSIPVALAQAGLSKLEIRRLLHAFEGVHRLDRAPPVRGKDDPPRKETIVVAKDKAKGSLLAFELVTSPFDVWQARVDEASSDHPITAKKVDLFVDHRRVTSSLALTGDLHKTIAAAHLREEALDGIDDALEGHVEATALKPGSRLRLVATEDWVEGSFARYHVDALEFVPKTGAPIRIYRYERKPSDTGKRRRFEGYFDAKGQKPYKGFFRSPLPFTRVTSRFNPKRLHPVLHTVMPHNGVDFGASTGTPVFASADGVVSSVGNGGRCGNMVQIEHSNGLTTAYCHLSKFAAGLHGGQRVEAKQLVGYVGQTGSATGPHLHFAVKRGATFIDPMSLKIDGVRVLPPSDREPFARHRAEMDAALDAIGLPNVENVPDEPAEKDEPAGEED